MSYGCGSPYGNYFSNPDVTYLGRPTGTPTEDNARTIEDNMVRSPETNMCTRIVPCWLFSYRKKNLSSTGSQSLHVLGCYPLPTRLPHPAHMAASQTQHKPNLPRSTGFPLFLSEDCLRYATLQHSKVDLSGRGGGGGRRGCIPLLGQFVFTGSVSLARVTPLFLEVIVLRYGFKRPVIIRI